MAPHIVRKAAAAFLLTAACYEHQSIVGASVARMSAMADALLECCDRAQARVSAWVLLPNHYHILATVADVQVWIHELGQLHGRTSCQWNGEDSCRGRKVWHRCAETVMKSERHFQATLLYVLHNPVRNRYVDRWQDWPFSNAHDWLAETGDAQARRLWKEFPLGHYGDDWDPPDM